MPTADFTLLCPGIWVWNYYAPKVKADLFSTAIRTGTGIYLVDSIPCLKTDLASISAAGTVAGVIVTNMNHWRATAEYSERFLVPIFARCKDMCHPVFGSAKLVANGSKIGGELEVIEIPGAGPAEIALYHPANGGTLIVGDALINFEPYGFSFLPRKYCEDENEMRISLRQLLNKPSERMLFAHGTPILSGATERLRQLLEAKT